VAFTGRTLAWINLAWNFGRHVVVQMPARLIGRTDDAQRFRDAVLPEGYVPLLPDERAAMPSFMRCISCGLCSLACPDIGAASASAWDEAWTFVAGPARSLDRAPLVAHDMTPCADCTACADVCPTGVPIPLLARTLRRVASDATTQAARALAVALVLTLHAHSLMAQQTERPRARDAGVVIGVFPTGPANAITDVAGVRVGHTTVRGEHGSTGVTAILPPGDNWFFDRVPAAIVVGNGFGKLLGVTQVRELGELETPILLTCTLCVWRAADAMADWLIARPGMQNVRSINPVVGETNDGALNDIRARVITREHVVAALESAAGGSVEEGAVGAGAGTVAFGWKGGIGTASRALPERYGSFTVGVIVQSNYGGILTINGAPVGRELGRMPFQGTAPGGAGDTRAADGSVDGSIMIVVATDAPLDPRHLERLAQRALFGLARTGATMSNGSGDYVIAFSTAASVRRDMSASRQATQLSNDALTPLFQAVAEATEEAILNSLFRATTTTFRGTTIDALPLERVLPILRTYGVIRQ
jgi:D-aminopeptidase